MYSPTCRSKGKEQFREKNTPKKEKLLKNGFLICSYVFSLKLFVTTNNKIGYPTFR